MFTLPETKFDFLGDEYIYAEISREMSLENNFKALAITDELRRRNIPGIIDICPANTSYLVRYDPEMITSTDLHDYLMDIDMNKSHLSEMNLLTKIVEIPTWYDDPLTREYSFKYKNRHQHPDLTDFEFAMRVNGFKERNAFIEAHSSIPYFITMTGYIPGIAWCFPLGLSKEEIIQVPKYSSPRTETPNRAVGIGGAFTAVYPVDSPGSYQLIGMSAVPVFDTGFRLEDLQNVVLARPGDIWKYRPIDEIEYRKIRSEVESGTFTYHIKEVVFSPEEYLTKGKMYIRELMEDF
ncbi:carboxyltransferase domain-containing protein [Bacillus salipaludis]|uniref:Carboxyltransferase domain-containing protein n=1 Tax=Bacillus salipaludis TaxID=2547811 RepID=A0A4R5VKU0_9BACI|nr:carboxyltransferase domain-containing protein [Bacillus salipaludis]MDQ6595637.1 carboxyltransferase domain-containing protein [Bacillus salipaludis]TDK58588.1 carboxyltransferase domain-containing protein [Bacillus salipaludis]